MKTKRALAAVLLLAMLVSLFSVAAFAAEDDAAIEDVGAVADVIEAAGDEIEAVADAPLPARATSS